MAAAAGVQVGGPLSTDDLGGRFRRRAAERHRSRHREGQALLRSAGDHHEHPGRRPPPGDEEQPLERERAGQVDVVEDHGHPSAVGESAELTALQGAEEQRLSRTPGRPGRRPAATPAPAESLDRGASTSPSPPRSACAASGSQGRGKRCRASITAYRAGCEGQRVDRIARHRGGGGDAPTNPRRTGAMLRVPAFAVHRYSRGPEGGVGAAQCDAATGKGDGGATGNEAFARRGVHRRKAVCSFFVAEAQEVFPEVLAQTFAHPAKPQTPAPAASPPSLTQAAHLTRPCFDIVVGSRDRPQPRPASALPLPVA